MDWSWVLIVDWCKRSRPASSETVIGEFRSRRRNRASADAGTPASSWVWRRLAASCSSR